jgi:predicted PhzF superfamily epimerase YddE/YHI9
LSRLRAFPLACEVRQGDEVGRPSRLFLEVDAARRIRVGGGVVEIARGRLRV